MTSRVLKRLIVAAVDVGVGAADEEVSFVCAVTLLGSPLYVEAVDSTQAVAAGATTPLYDLRRHRQYHPTQQAGGDRDEGKKTCRVKPHGWKFRPRG